MPVPQDGDCALHVIMRALLTGPAVSATAFRAAYQVGSLQRTSENTNASIL
jgi:hypothetical protein